METIFNKNSIKELNAQELEQIASFCSDEATFLLLKETFNHIESENNAMELPAASVKQNLDDLFAQTYTQNSSSAPIAQIPFYKQGYFRAIAAILAVAVLTIVFKSALSDTMNNTTLATNESGKVKRTSDNKKNVESKYVPISSVKHSIKENEVILPIQNSDKIVTADLLTLTNSIDNNKSINLIPRADDLTTFQTADIQLSSAKALSQTFAWSTMQEDADKFSYQSNPINLILPDILAVLFATY